jgi:hypothetical protein
MNRVGFSALVLAIGFVAAVPAANAQARTRETSAIVICRDGEVTHARYGAHACDGRGGIDRAATTRARRTGVYNQSGVYSNRGIYNGTVNTTANGQRGIYNGTVNGTVNGQRGVYSGGGVTGSNREIYGGTVNGNVAQDRDGDQHDRGQHKGWYKNKKDRD